MKDCIVKNYSINDNSNKEVYPVKYLCFEKINNVLFIGDETGWVKAYDINEYINYIKLMSNCSRIEYDNYEKKPKEKEEEIPQKLNEIKNKLKNEKGNNLKTKLNLVIKLSKLVGIKDSMNIKPVLLKEWQAHKNGISALSCYHNPIMYITAGHDLKVHIWDEKFELIGSLTNAKDSNWKVKIDIDSRKEKEKEFARNKYEELKNLDFDSLFEGETKLPKLIEYKNYKLENEEII